MRCPICDATMETVISEYVMECSGNCRYLEEFKDGAHRCFVNGVEYRTGDPTTIEGNLQAWNLYAAIQMAKEELR